jgi:pimeloyl-ACP methyl ester carboxylesterase
MLILTCEQAMLPPMAWSPALDQEAMLMTTAYLTRADGPRLAYRYQDGTSPTVVFCAGFLSDMTGSKAEALSRWCYETGRAFLRFDYAGHGRSDGQAIDGSIEQWRDDTLALVDAVTQGSLLLVGSSMGGWMSLLVARTKPARVKGLLLIAPAPDFTDWGMTQKFTAEQLQELEQTGRVAIPSHYGPEPYVYTMELLESGARCRLLDRSIALDIPVRILHGQQDPDVPWQLSVTLMEKIQSANVQLTLVKDGDHRLSRPQDVNLMIRTLNQMLQQI